MLLLKKLFFALPFLLFIAAFLYQINPFIKDYSLLFSLDWAIFSQILWAVGFILLASLCFIILASLANDWKIMAPVSLMGALIPLAFFPVNLSLILVVGLLVTLTLTFVFLENRLKSYINFQPNSLFASPIKTLASIIIFFTALVFYFSVNQEITHNGFKIPDSLLNTAVQFGASQSPQVQGVSVAQIPALTPEQIELLKQNPDLLKKYGIDPQILETLPQTPAPKSSVSPQAAQSPSNAVIKQLLQTQLEKIIEPYIKYLPLILALLFFVTFQSLFSLISIFLPILVVGTYWILEKTGYIHFDKEMREVRKLVV